MVERDEPGRPKRRSVQRIAAAPPGDIWPSLDARILGRTYSVASRITPELLAPLQVFTTVLIPTDADKTGDDLAARLVQQLGADRCRRVVFRDGPIGFKDANDALKAGWSGERFQAALVALERVDADDDSVLAPSVEAERGPYRVIDGQICRIRHDREGRELTQVLANFDARIFEEVAYDDGAEVVRAFRLRGKLGAGAPLSDVRVTAAEFGGMSWVASAWGARALVSAGAGARDHLRAAIQVLSDPVERVVFRHTGWRLHQGRWVYLYQGGGVGTDAITVESRPTSRSVHPPACHRGPARRRRALAADPRLRPAVGGHSSARGDLRRTPCVPHQP